MLHLVRVATLSHRVNGIFRGDLECTLFIHYPANANKATGDSLHPYICQETSHCCALITLMTNRRHSDDDDNDGDTDNNDNEKREEAFEPEYSLGWRWRRYVCRDADERLVIPVSGHAGEGLNTKGKNRNFERRERSSELILHNGDTKHDQTRIILASVQENTFVRMDSSSCCTIILRFCQFDQERCRCISLPCASRLPTKMFTCYCTSKKVNPPPSWFDIKDLFPHDENKISADEEDNYYTNCDASVWMRSCEEEVIEPLRPTEITGTIPKWLKGTLLRNGPGNLKVGKYHYQHLFDSSALLHRFGIADGEVTYQRRFVQTDVYKRNMAAQRIVFNEFGTKATPDPCKTIFHRVAAVFNPNKTLSDNSMISVYPFGDEYYTFTEAPVMHRIDPKNLETKDKINVSKYVNIVNHTSHPHVMNDGTVYNVGLGITPKGPRYHVVYFYPNSVTVDKSGKEKELSMFDQATIVASVPSRWLLNPSYMHTFGITENFFIIVEQPLSISFAKMTMSHLNQEPMMSSFKWHDNESTLIHVISRNTGQVVKTFNAETFFYLHLINQFETRDKDYVVLDMCCYRNPKMLECMYIDAMKNMHGNADFSRLFRARPLRFILPMKKPSPTTPPEHNLITIKTVNQNMETFQGTNNESVNRRPSCDINGNADDIEYENQAKFWRNEHKSALQKKASAHRLLDGSIFVKPELLCDIGCETPQINADFNRKEYRYFYAIACDIDLNNPGTLIKVDTFRKTKKVWENNGIYPSEPIFVPDPNGKNEDDGVIVSAIVWAEEETRVGLLILDAVTFTEIARATFDTPGPVPKCLHGWFSLDK